VESKPQAACSGTMPEVGEGEAAPEAYTLLKDDGNAKFKAGDFQAAVDAYTKSIELNPTGPKQHLCFSNRSAAYLKLGGKTEESLSDALACIDLEPKWAKGYSRQAASLQVLERYEEAILACETGLKAVPGDDGLLKMLAEARARQFRDTLSGAKTSHGIWHGKVSDVLGGYDQEMEFMTDGTSVRVGVLGRSIVGKFWLDCSHDPYHLNIQVPMQEPVGGAPPPVPYIAKLDEHGLHLCCPYLRMERPVDFEGPGYVLMRKGALSSEEDAEVQSLSREEKLLRCTKELLAALPDKKLEELSNHDSEDAAGEKLMAQVRFESSMFAVQKKFSESIMKEVLGATRGVDVPKELINSGELKELVEKLKMCGILDEEPPPVSTPKTEAPPRAAAAPSQASRATPSGSQPEDKASKKTADTESGFGQTASLVALSAVALGAIALLLWRRRQ